ncbi:MAG: right-handed parallel beta-helix repeat-containing protein [Actinomycetota bacterium]|nr:right-handed parallel beta-helix repeat-containing protein [Actinomycetota bacterium]
MPVGSASARSLFLIGCDESSDTDETALQAAVTAANDESHHPGEDVIQLTAGCTYTLETPVSSTYPRPGLPEVASTITVWGRGAVIQGPSAGYGVDHLFWVTDTGDLVLQDLTLAANAVAVVLGGAGVYNNGYLTLERVTLRDFDGGAVAASGQSTTVKDSVFKDNRIVNYHGAAISAYSSLIVQDSSFEENWAGHTDQRTPSSAAAIYLSSGAGGYITGTTFVGNDNDGVGGAIASNGSLAVTQSTFTRNTALNDGGAIHTASGSSLILTDSYFEANDAIRGGALNTSGTTSVTNSTFRANTAGGGGAVFEWGGVLDVTSSTFSGNDATVEADAFYRYSGTGTTSSSVFADHTSACVGLLAGDWNLLKAYDPSCPGNMLLGDPKLQAPALNGGPTKTMRLGAGSAAAERITSGCPSTDQRGYSRPSGAKCDIGAYEDQAPTAPGTPAITAGSTPTRTGALTLSWGASTDADDTVGYRLMHKDANDAASSLVGTTTATSLAVTEAEGTFSYVVEALDGNHMVSSSALTGIVVDKSRPLTPTVSADRTPDFVPAAGTSWYRDTVTVTTTSNGDPTLTDTSAGSGVASVTPAATYSTSGAFTTTGTATDAAGNISPGTSLAVNVDAEVPTAAFSDCPATVLLKHSATTAWTASDPSSGLTTPASGTFTLDTATVGHKSVSTTATDHVAHSTTITCGYDVIYDFTGFFTPLVNPPQVYKASAGQNVPVIFSLAGNQGLGVIATGYPQSVQTPCDAFGTQTTGSATTVVKPGLTFSSGSGGQYNYLWKTPTSWRGTCRQLVVKLSDGTYHRANLSFS